MCADLTSAVRHQHADLQPENGKSPPRPGLLVVGALFLGVWVQGFGLQGSGPRPSHGLWLPTQTVRRRTQDASEDSSEQGRHHPSQRRALAAGGRGSDTSRRGGVGFYSHVSCE